MANNRGNNYAEKYTEEVVLELFDKMLDFLLTPKVVSVSKREVKEAKGDTNSMSVSRQENNTIEYKPTTVLSALRHIGRTRTWLFEMNEKFKKSPRVSESYKIIKAQAEVNVLEAAEAGIINAKMAQLNLINNYDWVSANTKTEVTEVDAVLRNVEFEDDDS